MTARVKDHNGFYEVARNPLSKIGVFPYTKKSVGFPGWEHDPNGIVRVYRPAAELGDPETIKSFRLLPWVDDHAMLGDPESDPSLTPAEHKGVHGTTGEQVVFDSNDGTLYSNIKLWSRSLADAIDAGKKQLSMGFRCVYDFTQGIYEGEQYQAIQRTIRGNHQATVMHGRMGPGVAVLDHFSFALDASELREVPPMKVQRRVNVAAKMGVAPAALLAAFGLDSADAAVIAAFNTAMDAEEDAAPPPVAEGEGDAGGGAELTITEAATLIAEVAAPLSELNAALASLNSGTDPNALNSLEPALDSMTPACDAAIAIGKSLSARLHKSFATDKPAGLAAMDEAITTTESTMTALAAKAKAAPTPAPAGTALDARVAALETRAAPTVADMAAALGKRDALAKKVSPFIGTFAADSMDELAVAKYAADKLGLSVTDGNAVIAVEAYLHNRQPDAAPGGKAFGMDAAPAARGDVSSFVNGRASV